MGKSSINGPFSMAMLNYQRVYLYLYIYTEPLHTVDERNPASPWMVETCRNPINKGINHLSTGAGFLPSTVSIHVIRYFYWTIISKVVG